jgi:hypothetical protein
MLTDGVSETWDGVSVVADEVERRSGSLLATLLLGLLVFAVGAASGFLGRLLWPRHR